MAKKKARKKKAKRRAPAARRSAAASAASHVVSPLLAHRAELVAQLAGIEEQIAAVDQALGVLGGAAAPRPAGRRGGRVASAAKMPANARRGPRPAGASLRDFINKVLAGSSKAMSLKDITTSVVKTGYKTTSQNLSNQVSMTLAQMLKNKEVKKVARGMYSK